LWIIGRSDISKYEKEPNKGVTGYDVIGGNIFVFELLEHVRQRKNVKNLITLRPQKDYSKVEVYWVEKDKHFYKQINDNLFQGINKRFGKIGIPLK